MKKSIFIFTLISFLSLNGSDSGKDISEIRQYLAEFAHLLMGDRKTMPEARDVGLYDRVDLLVDRMDGVSALTGSLLSRCAQLERENRRLREDNLRRQSQRCEDLDVLKERMHNLECLAYEEVVEDEIQGLKAAVSSEINRRAHGPAVVFFRNPAFVGYEDAEREDDVFAPEADVGIGDDHRARGDSCRHNFRKVSSTKRLVAEDDQVGFLNEDGFWSPPMPSIILRGSSGQHGGEMFQMPHDNEIEGDPYPGYEPLGTPPSPTSPLIRRGLEMRMVRQRSLSVGDNPISPKEHTFLFGSPIDDDDHLKTQSMQDLRDKSKTE